MCDTFYHLVVQDIKDYKYYIKDQLLPTGYFLMINKKKILVLANTIQYILPRCKIK